MRRHSQSVLAMMASRVAFTLAMVGVECVVVVAYINRFEKADTAPRITSIVLGGGLFVVCSIYWFRTVARRSTRKPNAAVALGGGVALRYWRAHRPA